jgi:hypothetical protein
VSGQCLGHVPSDTVLSGQSPHEFAIKSVGPLPAPGRDGEDQCAKVAPTPYLRLLPPGRGCAECWAWGGLEAHPKYRLEALCALSGEWTLLT